jgi:hypothetical protein
MEQQPLLQRRQRQDVLRSSDTHSPAARSRPGSDRPAPDRSASARRRRERRMRVSAVSAGTRSRPDRGPPASSSSAPAQVQFATSRGPFASSKVSALISIRCASGSAGSPPPRRRHRPGSCRS